MSSIFSFLHITDYLLNNTLKILVKPNAKKTEILDWDENKKALRVSLKAHPQKGKANLEVVKFFSKISKKKVRIKSGLTSKEKLIVFE